MSKNEALSELFARLAAIMDIRGESPFKSIAFSKVSRLLKDMTTDIAKVVEDGTLEDVEGIGASSRKIIEDVIRTGRSKDYEEVAATIPPGLIDMLGIPSLGPKTIALLWKERQIESIDQLKAAIDAGKLEGIKGLGEKKIAGIREGIELKAQAVGRVGIGHALALAVPLLDWARSRPEIAKAEVAGSLRRHKETIGDVDILACLKPGEEAKAEAVLQAFTQQQGVKKVLGQGSTKASVLTSAGVQVDMRLVPLAHFGAALMYFTGSKEHNVKMRQRAQELGMTLNEWGLYKQSEYDKAEKKTAEAPSAKPVAAATEQDVFSALGYAFVPPEMREDRGELIFAAEKKLPRLVQEEDLRGDLHSHTTASDGANTIVEMAQAAAKLGYSYLAITDHSKSQAIARGLDEQRLLKHIADIRKAQAVLDGQGIRITLLAGSEVDILADGSMDYSDEILQQLDWVVASPHTALKQDTAKATARIIRAMENKFVNVIGHPTGRLINERAGLPLDFDAVIKAAASTGTALEINAAYPRLDLSEQPARAAVEAGVMLTIDTDAHSVEGLASRHFGIGVARRAWVEPRQVLNCQPLEAVRKFVMAKR